MLYLVDYLAIDCKAHVLIIHIYHRFTTIINWCFLIGFRATIDRFCTGDGFSRGLSHSSAACNRNIATQKILCHPALVGQGNDLTCWLPPQVEGERPALQTHTRHAINSINAGVLRIGSPKEGCLLAKDWFRARYLLADALIVAG